MKTIYFLTKEEASKALADKVIALIKSKPNLVLGLPTGSTPILFYKHLVEDHKQNKTDWSKVKTFNLDEYLHAGPNDPFSYQYFMNEQLFAHVNIDKKNAHFPLDSKNPEAYDHLIKNSGGIDFMILGIGINAHIGFNEPKTPFDSHTRISDLTQETIKRNAELFFNNDFNKVPKQAITMGIKTILSSKEITVLAFGEIKREAVENSFKKPANVNVPSSALQNHNHVSFYIDIKL